MRRLKPNNHFCRTRQRHSQTALTRTVVDRWKRLRTVASYVQTQRGAHTPSTPRPPDPQTPRVKREPLLRIWEQLVLQMSDAGVLM